ncbi:MAG TPA: aminopeptidase N [Acidimicrobiales bacterium]|nr:aminopeptidase N [Acidimicrobiales bacterium]
MNEDNLTRAEAEERAKQVSSISYDISLDLTTGEETFRSETVIHFTAPLVGMATFVDLDAEAVHEFTFNNREVDLSWAHDPSASRIKVRGLLANNELRVVADCAYQHTGVGLHRVNDPVDGNVYLHTQFEPFDAHRVFACFDQPDLKATYALSVTAPEQWTVISNSPVVSREGGVWRFAPTAVISTYLMAVVAGPYHVVEDSHDGIPLGLYCRKSLAEHLDPDEIFEVTRQGLDFFRSEFAYPYPFPKYEQLFVPEFNFGAMENPGCVTFNEQMVFRSRVTESAYESRANVILHEMAHMWFGDLVTMRWWDDLWLNESFATYMATHAQAEATRFTSAWARFAWGTKMHASSQDQLPSTHPISADIVDTDAVRLHFDGITYSKGASVLKQLAAWVGVDQFREALRGYFPEHEWSNAELSDFLAALEATSGRDLGAWSKEWLETAGVNTLRASFAVPPLSAAEAGGDDGTFTSFAVVQEAHPDWPTLRSHRVALGLYNRTPEGVVRSKRVEVDVAGARTDVAELVGLARPDLLIINDDDLTYAKVRLDGRSIATLSDSLSEIRDPLARSLCWAATWDMVRDGELATRRFVQLVLDHAATEADDSVLARLLGQALAALDVYGDPSNRSAARQMLSARAREELERSEPGGDRQLVWARHAVSAAESDSDLAFARGMLDGTETLGGLAVDTDLRWQIVGLLSSRAADDGGALIDAELQRDPTDIGERRAAACRAGRPTADAKASAWDQLMGGEYSLAVQRSLTGGFAHWGQVDLVRPYVDPYFKNFRQWWDERTREEALVLIKGLFPSVLVEETTVAITDSALADDSLPGPLRRILLENKDGVQRALRARAADHE